MSNLKNSKNTAAPQTLTRPGPARTKPSLSASSPTADASSFFAAITLAGIPVWKAGGDSGAADSSSSLQFLADGNLRLVNGSSSLVWQSDTTDGPETLSFRQSSIDLANRA
ncbi:hypothetical protein U1Q18_009075 [Sarracenia purpurea var. burkii]